MVVNSIAAALKRIYASVIHAKQVSLSVPLSVSRAEGLILARFFKSCSTANFKIINKYDTEISI